MTRWVRTVWVLALVITAPSLPACTRPVTIHTHAGMIAYPTNELLKRVEELQDAAIAGNRNGSISNETAKAIVFTTVNIADLAGAAPQGWQAVALKGWEEAKAMVPALRPGGAYAVLAAAVDAALQGVIQ